MLWKLFRAAALGLLVFAHAALADPAPRLSRGEIIHAPAYSDVPYGKLEDLHWHWQQSFAAQLSIRNTKILVSQSTLKSDLPL